MGEGVEDANAGRQRRSDLPSLPSVSGRPNGGKERATPDRSRAPSSSTPRPFGQYWWLISLAGLLVNYIAISLLLPVQSARVDVSYTFFKQQVATDNVAEINSRADTIQGSFSGSPR